MPEQHDTAPATQTFAHRARAARDHAGLTRPVAGGLVGRSAEWVKGIETGAIGMPRLPMLIRLATVYECDIADLTGDERIAAATYTKASHSALPAIKRALTTYRLAPAGSEPESAEVLAARVRQAWKLWHGRGDHRSSVAPLLPDLLADTQHAARALDGAERRHALVVQAQTYHLTQLFLAFQPEPELIMLTGDRSMTAAQDADSPRAMAGAAWYMNHVYRDANEAADARVELAEEAAALLRQDNEEDLARWGLLQLAVALSFAKVGREGLAWRYWDRADDAARRLGEGYAHPWMIFGRGVVDAYALTMHLNLVKPGKALEVVEAMDLDSVPSATRRSFHLIESARAHGMQGEGVAAVALLQKAHKASPETIRYNTHARMVLPELAKAGPRMVREDARELALKLGIST
ncbi:helix-turn-helix domain-containing protein [Streptomyces sp. NBC_00597]|uniref:helix-turn-helix domain-containing protein n=1 Tax=unclassified Streptomyces TaxID=2593676 RepID=UPI002E0F840A|nr:MULTISPECIES: helix-turn-helix transcriptional regulator [unclassified Streptomyces]WSR21770.1 helix-turn-helix domain-containing protein [Streptomyces sp. NBC_01205]